MSSTWKKLKKTFRFSSSPKPSSSSTTTTTTTIVTSLSSAEGQSSSAADPPVPARKSASLGSRLSRSFSLHLKSNSCPICMRSLKKDKGRAIFYAECSHSFHYTCIAESVKHGNLLCPICRTKWNNLPFQAPRPVIPDDPHQRNIVGRRNDEQDVPLSQTRTMTVQAFPEFPAVSASDSRSGFGVLVRIRAPTIDQASGHGAPIDLVAVLDVSGSMVTKLPLLQQAVRFVIHNLSPLDRLSIVTFSTEAHQVLPLRRMSDEGREEAIKVVNYLEADGGTNIVAGLKKGVEVLEYRHDPCLISSIMLLSDGRDTHTGIESNHHNCNAGKRIKEYLQLLPASIRQANSSQGSDQRSALQTFPVYTFGFGLEHDSMVMNAISDASGGTFSFIESSDILQDAFARCIGGLLSVVAQDVRLHINSISEGVRIGSIPSGRYIVEILDQGHQATITIGNLYAEEEKEFLVTISFPEETAQKTQLLNVACSYKSSSSSETLHIPCQIVEIRRPRVLSPADQVLSLDVDRQRNRLLFAETLAEAHRMAETCNLEAARKLLSDRKTSLLSSMFARSGDGLSTLLEAELEETESRMKSWMAYDQCGRAYILSGLSSHSFQRATTRAQSRPFEQSESSRTSGTTMTYDTPSMSCMVSKSKMFQGR